MARPKKVIDVKLVEKLAAIHCTIAEIADICEVSRDTIERRYAALIAKARAEGKMSLRKYQWEAVKKGNVSMMIWLGKQLLDQRDSFEPPPAEAPVDTKAEVVIRWVDEDEPGDAAADATTKKV